MFDVDALIADLEAAMREPEPRLAAKEVLARALARPDQVADTIAPPAGGLTLLHHRPHLTVINIAWAPGMQLMPHDHRMWALIGIYQGREDNQFFRRDPETGLTATTGKRLEPGEPTLLGAEAIHSVANPGTRLTGAIHVYGGDFVRQPRSQWGPGDLVERPFEMAEVERQFAEANAAAGL
jgi:predicted metal-dependent enzyme (double-stranded beta helix superfamily)